MYFTTLYDQLHGNYVGFISLSKTDIKKQLIPHLQNFDTNFTHEEIATILKEEEGYAGQADKSWVLVTIIEIQPGQEIDLELR